MARNMLLAGAVSLAAVITSSAKADLVIAAPVVVPFDGASATVTFIESFAGYTGNLYFLGSGDANTVLAPAPNSDATGLGQFLFNNQTAIQFDAVVLTGIFDAGDVLHFAYDIVAPPPVEPELFRTDVPADQDQFAYNAMNGDFGIEDVEPGGQWYDGDYNDIIVNIRFAQIPTPGAAVLTMLGLLVGMRRRRRLA